MMRNKKMIRSGFGQRWFWWTVFSGLMMVLCTGCGSSGGGGGGDNNSNDLLNGTYHLNQFADSAGDIWTQRIQVIFDGNGNLSWDILSDSGGDTGSGSGTYRVAADGTMTDPEDGIVSPDGSIFSFIDTDPSDPDTEIAFSIGLETSTGMGLSSLNGDYLMCQIRYNQGNARIHTSRIEITANGTGGIIGAVLADSNSGPGALPPLSYTVDPDGTLKLTGTDFTGPLSSDGNIFVLMDTDKTNDPVGDEELLMMVGIKKSSGMSVSSLSGVYQMNLFGGDNTSSWTTRIDATFDGAGTITATILADSGGDLTTPPAMSYTVNPDGTFSITDTGDQGIIAPGGDVFIVVDTTGGDVMLTIGIAKS